MGCVAPKKLAHGGKQHLYRGILSKIPEEKGRASKRTFKGYAASSNWEAESRKKYKPSQQTSWSNGRSLKSTKLNERELYGPSSRTERQNGEPKSDKTRINREMTTHSIGQSRLESAASKRQNHESNYTEMPKKKKNRDLLLKEENRESPRIHLPKTRGKKDTHQPPNALDPRMLYWPYQAS